MSIQCDLCYPKWFAFSRLLGLLLNKNILYYPTILLISMNNNNYLNEFVYKKQSIEGLYSLYLSSLHLLYYFTFHFGLILHTPIIFMLNLFIMQESYNYTTIIITNLRISLCFYWMVNFIFHHFLTNWRVKTRVLPSAQQKIIKLAFNT